MSAIKRATRPFFGVATSGDQLFYEESIEFDWHSGMSWIVRQRSSDALAEAIVAKYGKEKYGKRGVGRDEILEVSTASHSFEIGRALSATILSYQDEATNERYAVENWFQAAKVLERDGSDREWGPYPGLLECDHPKRYVDGNLPSKLRAHYEGDSLFDEVQCGVIGSRLKCFRMDGRDYPLMPRSAFYDHLYVKALFQDRNADLADSLCKYRVFTDIMFNPGSGKRRRFNTQARSCAIYAALAKRGYGRDDIADFDSFVRLVGYKEKQEGRAGADGLRTSTLF